LEIYGLDKVLKHVGIEPSGDAFNSIMLEENTNRPFNPMVNAGAITVTAMLYEHYGNEAFDIMLKHFGDAAGRELKFDEEVYKSESKTGHRNRAIAHLLLNFGMVHENIEPALDLYFKQCAILVNTLDLAMMAATIANVGENPVTSKEVFGMYSVRNIMSIMFTCGMYDFSGEWAYKVGIPAKSGVSGGLMAVVNRQMGIATYSPRLDKYGNSVRGVNACIELSSELGLHVFDYLNNGSSFLNIVMQK
jgi:glutaminase